MKKEFEEKEQQLRQDITKQEKEIQDMAQGVTLSNSCLDAFRERKNISSLNRGIVVQLIKAIRIHEGANETKCCHKIHAATGAVAPSIYAKPANPVIDDFWSGFSRIISVYIDFTVILW